MNWYEKADATEQAMMEEKKRQEDAMRAQHGCTGIGLEAISPEPRNMVSEIEEALERVQAKAETINQNLTDNANRLLGEERLGQSGESAFEGYPGELGQILNRLNRLNERLVDAEHQSRRFYSA